MLEPQRFRRPWSRRGLPVLTLLVPFLLFALPGVAQDDGDDEDLADDEGYGGTFVLSFEAPSSAALKPFYEEIKASQLFQTTVEELNETIALPEDLQINFKECGVTNAFYNPEDASLSMCYELVAYFFEQFQDNYEDEDEAENATVDATLFVFHHELGHALVDLLELPITGKEEDAVDDLATLVLLHDWEGGDESALNAAEAFYMMGEEEEGDADEDAIENLPYWDEHSLGKQRYYQIACTVYGSDPEAHADLVGDDLPEERAVRCPAEYEQKSASWDTLLADYYYDDDDEADDEDDD